MQWYPGVPTRGNTQLGPACEARLIYITTKLNVKIKNQLVDHVMDVVDVRVRSAQSIQSPSTLQEIMQRPPLAEPARGPGTPGFVVEVSTIGMTRGMQ